MMARIRLLALAVVFVGGGVLMGPQPAHGLLEEPVDDAPVVYCCRYLATEQFCCGTGGCAISRDRCTRKHAG